MIKHQGGVNRIRVSPSMRTTCTVVCMSIGMAAHGWVGSNAL